MSILRLKDLKLGGYCYFPAVSEKYFKIEKLVFIQKDQDGQEYDRVDRGFRIYLNTNAIISPRRTEKFSLKIQKDQPEGSVSERYYLQTKSFGTFYDLFLKELTNAQVTNDDREISKYMTTYQDILNINKSSTKDYFTALTVVFPIPTSEEEGKQLEEIKNQIKLPDEEFLTTLSDFSKIPIEFSFEVNKKKIGYKEAKEKIDEILKNSKLSESIISELRSIFNVDEYLNYVNKNSDFWTKLNPSNWSDKMKEMFTGKTPKEIFLSSNALTSGGIMHGPPGTGKTFMVRNTIFKIYQDVFGYEVIEIPMSDLSQGASYYGALLQAVTRIFMKALKQVQLNRKPVLIFVDEFSLTKKNVKK